MVFITWFILTRLSILHMNDTCVYNSRNIQCLFLCSCIHISWTSCLLLLQMNRTFFFIMRSIFRIIVLLTNEFPWFNNKKRPKGDYIFFFFSISYRDRQFVLQAVYSLVSKIVYLNHVFHTKDCRTIKKAQTNNRKIEYKYLVVGAADSKKDIFIVYSMEIHSVVECS